MDTACLRIKFTPLLQKNNKNSSKCCLEIVPEVSCIQNLDKLTWRQETNFIEYTIPMTYKVILKKRQAMTNANSDLVKTYHSCVDLLLASSKSTLNLGSGDVSKIISDTFIFNKPVVSNPSEENVTSNAIERVPTSDIIHKYPVLHKTTNTSIRIVDCVNKETKTNDDGTVKSNVQPNIESVILDKASLDKITSTESIYPIPDNTITGRNSRSRVELPKCSSKLSPESRRKLSLSPICSVSTQQAPLLSKNVSSKAVTCKIYDSQKDIVPIGCLSTPSNLSNENQISKELSTIIDISGQSSRRKLRSQCRVPPELRVAEHVQYMEKEVLPLKAMFNEIINKCSTLGINFSCNKKPSNPSLMYKSLSMHSSPSSPVEDVIKTEEIAKSNRVVYSIVFDASVNMKNQQAVVDQIVQNLAFEVEAVPKEPSNNDSSLSKMTPLNVKIKVRKKDEVQTDNEGSSVTDEHMKTLQRIRLVSSDQTIMTFDVFMEAEFERKPSKKSKKHIFDILRPGLCLNTFDNDGHAYMPSSSYSANITEPSAATRSDGVLRQKFTLSKNNYENYSVATHSGVQKWPFGKCKPGGCLDPPFSEDRYPYKPSLRSGNEQIVRDPDIPEEQTEAEDVKTENKSNGRHSSIFDGGLFKKKRKSSDKSTNTKGSEITDEINSNASLFDIESTVNSLSTHSNSIITYPPKISSDLRIGDDKTVRSRGPSEDKSRKSFNEHSEPYFVPPKGVNRIKEKDYLNQNDYTRPSKEIDLGKNPDSLKMPFPVPIPIPIPFVIGRKKSDGSSENLDTQDEDDERKNNPIPDDDGVDEDDNVMTATNSTHSKIESPKQDIEDNAIQNQILPHSNSSCGSMRQKASDNDNLKINDANKSDQTSQPDNVYDDIRTNSNDIPKKSKESRSMPVPLPIPIPVPLNFGKDKRPTSLANEVINEQSDQSLSSASGSKNNTESPGGLSDDENSNEGNKLIQSPKRSHRTSRDSLSKDQFVDENPATDALTVPGDGVHEPNNDNIKDDLEKFDEPDNIKRMGDQGNDLNDNDLKKTNAENNDDQLILNDDANSKTPSDKTGKIGDMDIEAQIEDDGDKQPVLSDNNYEMKHMLRTGTENDTDTETLSDNKLPLDNEDDGFKSPTNYDNQPYSFKNSPTFISKKVNNLIAAPVLIDDSEQSPPYGKLKPIFSSTDLTDDTAMHDIYNDDAVETKLISQFGVGDDDTVTHSSHSHELVGTKSVIYDTDGYISMETPGKKYSLDQVVPQASKSKDTSKNMFTPIRPSDATKPTDNDLKNNLDNKKIVRSTSVLSSTSTLKSALKKDTISVELAFHSYLNDKNERVVRTFNASRDPLRVPNDTITLIKSQIRISSNEIRIPVDSDHDLSIQIKKPYTNQRVSISESGFGKSLDGKIRSKASAQTSGGDLKMLELDGFYKIGDDIRDTSVVDLYEQELIPLQLIIKSLRDEIDVLAAQQMMFRDKIFSPKKTKLPRLVHSNKKCVGCLKK